MLKPMSIYLKKMVYCDFIQDIFSAFSIKSFKVFLIY